MLQMRLFTELLLFARVYGDVLKVYGVALNYQAKVNKMV